MIKIWKKLIIKSLKKLLDDEDGKDDEEEPENYNTKNDTKQKYEQSHVSL